MECVIGAVVADGCVAAGGGCGVASGCMGRQLARMECWGGARAEVEFDRTMAARMAWMTSGWVITAIGRKCPPHGQARTLKPKTRASRSARVIRRGRSGAVGRWGVGSGGDGTA